MMKGNGHMGSNPVLDLEMGSYLSRGFWERFEEVATLFPDVPAFALSGRQTTYREVRELAEALACRLEDLTGGVAGCIIEVEARLQPSSIVAFLAVLRSKAVLLPMDPGFPEEFQQEIRRQVSPFARLGAGEGPEGVTLFRNGVHPEIETGKTKGAAALLWTSGSTGHPKGILLPGSLFLVDAWNRLRNYRLAPGDRVAWTAPPVLAGPIALLSFSILGGLTLVPLPLRSIDTGDISGILRDERVCYVNPPVSYYRQWMNAAKGREDLPDLRTVVLGGQPVNWKDILAAGRRLPEKVSLFHRYAASETGLVSQACFSGAGFSREEGAVPSGFPPNGKRTVVLSEDRLPLPAGEVGEIGVISWHGALGYWNRPDLEEERIRELPGGEKMFLTGDLGRFREDGQLELFGRMDGQLKIRGFRVEPAQVEVSLRGLGGVEDAVVVPWAPPGLPDEKEILAYVVPSAGTRTTVDHLRAGLQKSLPEYMLPTRFILLAEMPRTRNGKPDRTRLPAPGTSRPDLSVPFDPPVTEMETRLSRLWEEVLGISPIGLEDDFFDLGGHSLSAARLFGRIETDLGSRIPLADMLRVRTVRSMASLLIENEGKDPGYSRKCLVRIDVRGDRPALFLVHGGGGEVLCFARLASLLPGFDVYALQALGLNRHRMAHLSMQEMVASYTAEIRQVQPAGPYRIVGYSFGGAVAFELAVQLQASGEQVAYVGLLDRMTPSRSTAPRRNPVHALSHRLRTYLKHEMKIGYARILLLLGRPVPFMHKIYKISTRYISRAYTPSRAFHGQVAVFQTEQRRREGIDPRSRMGWGPYVTGEVKVYPIPGTHNTLLDEPHVRGVATAMSESLNEAGAAG